MTKPNFMTKTVNLADTVCSKPAGDTSNSKRQIKRVNEKNLEEKQTVTPKKRPARGRFICWFPHRYATFGDNALFFVDAGVKTCDESNKLLVSGVTLDMLGYLGQFTNHTVCRLLTVCHERRL